ncbi:penicillin acylase family protein [Longivirga aurantiaca]|uniref:Penicillin acylase family protein n=1 Tax=Longivirga aurantiaca TaxID=1837743 RepID=A0ABW1SXZ5_9ACTN
MRRLGKVLGIIGIVLLVLVVAAATFGAWTVRRSFPQVSGELALKGLKSEVTVLRDERGIPQIYAASAEDLMFAQGYVHAQDRFWEMDFRRHITAGRLSELFGKSQVETDTYLRTLGWRRVAERELALLSPETRRNLDSYSAGVNAWLADHSGATASLEYAVLGLQNSGYVIEPWSPVDSIAWLKAMAWDLRGNMQEEISRSIISATVGEKRTAQLFPPYPYLQHRPIVTQGAVVDGVWDQNAPRDIATAAGLAPAVPPDAVDVLRATGAASEAITDMLGPDGPGIGSNSWVISGEKTETGLPLLANDPHLGPMMPSIWYQIGLHCTTVSAECPYDMAGYSFSGLPGIVIGHNQTVGWGFTNLGPDVTDLYLEKVEGDTYLVGNERKQMTTRQETIKVAGGDDVVITVRETEHGPLLSDASEELRTVGADAPAGIVAPPKGDGYAVALRWTALEPGRTADAIDRLNRAQTWEDFRSAASIFEVPAQNLIFASVDGTIGYQTPGKIPIRSGYDGKYPAHGWDPKQTWTGYIPFEALPNVKNPDDGWVVTANQASVYESYPFFLTDDWSYGARSQRIVDLVKLATSDGQKMTADRMREIQFDAWNENAAFLVPKIKALNVEGVDGVALLNDWDFTQPADSAPAAYFNVFWKNLLTDVFMDELPEDEIIGGGDRWFTAVRDLWDSPDDAWWDDTRTPDVQESRDDAVRTALQEAQTELAGLQGGDPQGWRWGALHTLLVENQTFGTSGITPIEMLFNRGPVETSGGESIVNATGWTLPEYTVDWVPSMRMVLDMSDLDRSTWVNLTGASGHAYHPNYVDQLDAWAAGDTFPFPFTKPAVEAAATDTLTLTPAG